MTELDYTIRSGNAEDIANISSLILEHGPNQWNHLPEDEVRQHVGKLALGEVSAVVAESKDSLVGVVTYEIGRHYPQYQPVTKRLNPHSYIAEAVVHKQHVGEGIGSSLLRAAITALQQDDITEIYAMRHADNMASARMMQNCGMEVIDVYDDPKIRPSGSRKTAVTRLILPS